MGVRPSVRAGRPYVVGQHDSVVSDATAHAPPRCVVVVVGRRRLPMSDARSTKIDVHRTAIFRHNNSCRRLTMSRIRNNGRFIPIRVKSIHRPNFANLILCRRRCQSGAYRRRLILSYQFIVFQH